MIIEKYFFLPLVEENTKNKDVFREKNLITSALALVLASTSISSFANTDISESYIIKFNDEFKGKTHIPKGLLKQVYSGKFKKTFKSKG